MAKDTVSAAASRVPSATITVLGLVCLVEAVTGGGVTIQGASFPLLTTLARVLVGILGAAIVFPNVTEWLANHNPTALIARLRSWIRLGSWLIGLAAVVIFFLLLDNHRSTIIADPPALAANFSSCPVRPDTGTDSQRTGNWVFLGFKIDPNSDTLDPYRNIQGMCVPRAGETVTVYREIHVWNGDPEEKPLVETANVVKPGQQVTIKGAIFGPVVMRASGGKLTRLYYEVWGSF